MKIIGLLGGAKSGKTTVADHLVAKYGARKFSFAEPLKELLARAFDLSHEQLYGDLKETVDERYSFSPRELMQRVGQAARETFGTDFWVRECLRRISNDANMLSDADMPTTPSGYLAVVDDCRYINEAEGIRLADDRYSTCSSVWRLECPWRQTNADPTHQSEAEWMKAPYDAFIVSDTPDLDKLYASVDCLAASYGLLPLDAQAPPDTFKKCRNPCCKQPDDGHKLCDLCGCES